MMFSTLAAFGVQVLDVEQIVLRRRLVLGVLVTVPRDWKALRSAVERVADRDVYVATARIDPTTTRTLYFDVVTGLLRRELTTTETMLLPLEEQIDYDDYRDVGGVRLPFRMRTSDGAPYSTVTRTFVQIRRNVPVDEALFRPPSGGR